MSDDAMLESFVLGASVEAIADAAGLSVMWTYRRLKRAGAEIERPAPRPCPVPVEQLAREYAAGDSILTIADRHGLYFKRVRELLLGQGVTLRPSTKGSRP